MDKSRFILNGMRWSDSLEQRRPKSVDLDKEITVTITLRGKNDSTLSPLHYAGSKAHLTVSQAVRTFSHSAAHEAAVRRFAREYDLDCTSCQPFSVELSGTVGQMNRAFGVHLLRSAESKYQTQYHVPDTEISLPVYLYQIVTGVFGLDNRPAGKRHGLTQQMAGPGMTPPPVTAKTRKPAEFATLYDFPATTGRGQSIGLLEFGGGFRPRQLKSYFKSVGVTEPRLIVKEVPPGGNRPRGKPGTLNPDTEVYLDIEVAASLAPEATFVVYFGEDNEQGWLRTLRAAILDRNHDLSVISISWGEAEQQWTSRAIREIDRVFQLAARRGITICCSSGDNGVTEWSERPFSIAFPASSPHVLACGGTQLEVKRSGLREETVWNQWRKYKLASGGGFSSVFAVPPYQKGMKRRSLRTHKPSEGRGIPDVAANASSNTGYLIEADHTSMSMGGTSAVAPLWAALVARLNEALGTKVGFLTPLLYEMNSRRKKVTRDIVNGFNGPTRSAGYQATRGWDACTGLGSPNGNRILEDLKSKIKKNR